MLSPSACRCVFNSFFFFFFNDTATTEIYTLSLHDALPLCPLTVRFRVEPQAEPQPSHAPWLGAGSNGCDSGESVKQPLAGPQARRSVQAPTKSSSIWVGETGGTGSGSGGSGVALRPWSRIAR